MKNRCSSKGKDRLENLLKQVARLLAANTQYASMISSPVIIKNKIKFIQLTQVDPQHVLAVIVIEGNLIRNTMIDVEGELGSEQLLKLNMLLNSSLDGVSVDQINLGLVAAIKQQAGESSGIAAKVIDSAAEVIRADEHPEIYTSGTDNIFRYPELSDQQKAAAS
jgi:heat-inducible transcriptional repressor